ncbi:MAG TPA: hypothetical protein VF399_07460 [bacterium]
MKIEVLYIPAREANAKNKIIRKHIDVPPETRIEDILPLFSAKGLAVWHEDKYGGLLIENYHEAGPIMNNTKYAILSANIEETIKKLNAYHD